MKKLLALVCAAALLLSFPLTYAVAEPASDAPVTDWANFVTFGDSLTALSKWPQNVATNMNMVLINSGIGGNTTEDGRARFDRAVRNQNPDFVVIGFGTNDFARPSSSVSQVSLARYTENMQWFIDEVKGMNAVPILLTCPFVNEDTFGQTNYRNEGGPQAVLDTYNAKIRELATANNVALIDIRKECDKYTKAEFLVADGVHLSALGQSVYTQMLTNYMTATFNRDPNAQPVPVPQQPPVKDGYWTQDIISFNPSDWLCPREGTVNLTNGANGELIMSNTTGLWPDVHYSPTIDKGIAIPVSGSDARGNYLTYDFDTNDVSTNITLFLNGSTPTLAYDANYIYLNRIIKRQNPGVVMNGDDIAPHQHLQGTIKLTDLIPEEMIQEDGTTLFSGVKVFVVGEAGKTMTINKLSVTRVNPQDVPLEPEYANMDSLLPTKDTVINQQQTTGVASAVVGEDGSLRVTRASGTPAWPSIKYDVNKQIDLSETPYLYLNIAMEGGSANGFIFFTKEDGSTGSVQFSDAAYGVPNDFETDTKLYVDLAAKLQSNEKITVTAISMSVYGIIGNAVVWKNLDTAVSYIAGDMDGNGSVNALDARQLFQYASGAEMPLTLKQKMAADITGEGEINTTDSLYLYQYTAGIRPALKAEKN